MAQQDEQNKSRRDKRGRFTEEGASYYGRLGGEASRNARRARRNKSKDTSSDDTGFSNT